MCHGKCWNMFSLDTQVLYVNAIEKKTFTEEYSIKIITFFEQSPFLQVHSKKCWSS